MKGKASSSADVFHSNTTDLNRPILIYDTRDSSNTKNLQRSKKCYIRGCTGADLMLVLLASVIRCLVTTTINCSNFKSSMHHPKDLQ